MSLNRNSRSPMYMVDGMMGHDGAGFVKCVQGLYTKHKKSYPNTKRPTTIKASIAFAQKLGYKVYTKESGSNWMLI